MKTRADPVAPRPIRRGIQTRVAVLVLVASSAPLALLAWITLLNLVGLRHALLQERTAWVDLAAFDVEHNVRGVLEALSAVPVGPADSEPMRATQRDALRLARMRSRLLENAFLVDDAGRILVEETPVDEQTRRDLAGCPELHEAWRRRTPVVCIAGADAPSERRYAVVPLSRTNGASGVAAAGTFLPGGTARAALLPKAAHSPGAHLRLIDDHGRIIAGPPAPPGKRTDVVLTAKLTVLPWTLTLTQPADEIFAPIAETRRRIFLLAPALVGVAFVFAWGIAGSVKRPIAELERAAARIAAGDLARPVPPLGGDEIGRLGRSFEAMRLALSKDETRRLLLRKVITAQEEERKRIARELHDETCQTLTALKLKLDLAGRAEEQAMASRSLDELYRIIHDLRPSILDDLGLLAAVRWLAERQLAPLGVRLRYEFDELPQHFPAELEIAIFRATQEAINNIARHASAETVHISISIRQEVLEINIEDDGAGFDAAALGAPDAAGRGLGILGLHERLELIGGSARIVSSPGAGTQVSLRVPLPPGGVR